MNKHQSRNNIILFPHLEEKLLKQANEAREQKDFEQVIQCFVQLLRTNPEHTSALYGLAVTYYEMGQYPQTLEIAEHMLHHQIGDRLQVLRLHIITLMQLERFNEANDQLEQLLHSQQLSEDERQELIQLQETCRMLADEQDLFETEEDLIRMKVIQDAENNPHLFHDLTEQLIHGTYEEQLLALERLKFLNVPEVSQVFKEYLVLPKSHPILKTFALRALKEIGETGTVSVHKFDQIVELQIEDVPLDEKDIPVEQQQVIRMVSERKIDQDPTFHDFAYQIWMEYLLTVYPLVPGIEKPEAWAAALDYVTHQVMNRSTSSKEIARSYSVYVREMIRIYHEFNRVLQLTTSP